MDLATVDKLLTTTRTVRKRLNLTRPVDPEIIQGGSVTTYPRRRGQPIRFIWCLVPDNLSPQMTV
jgi:hypothetical protein